MTRTTHHAALFAAACIFPAVTWPQGVPAPAEPAGQAAASASAARSSAPIALSDIVAQAESASSTLKEIAADGTPDPATEAIERDLPALTDEINARLEEAGADGRRVDFARQAQKLRSRLANLDVESAAVENPARRSRALAKSDLKEHAAP